MFVYAMFMRAESLRLRVNLVCDALQDDDEIAKEKERERERAAAAAVKAQLIAQGNSK